MTEGVREKFGHTDYSALKLELWKFFNIRRFVSLMIQFFFSRMEELADCPFYYKSLKRKVYDQNYSSNYADTSYIKGK